MARKLLNLLPTASTGRKDVGATKAELHKTAKLATAYDDFGDGDYLEGLGRLLEAIDSGNYTSPQRERIRRDAVVPLLRGRLYSERGWRDHPQCLANPIPTPVVICGLPRSGTTALHKLLSVDRRFQGLNGWLISYPMPRPPRNRWPLIPEYRAVAAAMKGEMSASATHRAAHFRSADEVDECLGLMSQSFVSNLFPVAFHLPGYDEWFRAQDQRPTYRRFADNLRLIGSNNPDQPWLLKNPGHILALDALLDVFPDARIVQTHRHPGLALASLSSLLAALRTSMLGPDVTTDDIASREVDVWSQATKNALDARDRRPGNFHDVDYRDLVADPLGVARSLYARIGIDLDPTTEAAMHEWVSANPQGKHGVHTYNSEPYGISEALIEREFAEYIERFGLARSHSASSR